tara:strand:+ start:4907 stop:6142 length:1236 start_codon:yes stop_codon:yes gene_type:complete
MSKSFFWVSFVSLLILTLPGVFAIGIGVTPPLVDVTYGESDLTNMKFTIIPEGGEDYVKLFALSSLKEEPVEFPEIADPGYVHVRGRTDITFNLDLTDEDIIPGNHRIKIYIQQEAWPPDSGKEVPSGISARAAVVHVVKLFVPHTGGFLKMDFKKVGNVDSGKDANFNFYLANLGKSALEDLEVSVNIFDKDDNVVGSVESGKISIDALGGKDISLPWPTKGRDIGAYRAVATATYGDETRTAEQSFLIGDIQISLDSVVINTSKNVGKVSMAISSQWNDIIEDAYASFTVQDKNGNPLKSSESQRFSLTPWEKIDLELFFEYDDLPLGVYLGEASVHYLGRSSKRVIEFYNGKDSLVEKPASLFNATNFLLAVIVILLLAMIALGGYFVMAMHHPHYKKQVAKKRKSKK